MDCICETRTSWDWNGGSGRCSPFNWFEPQSIVVTGVDDATVDGSQDYLLTFTANASLSDDAFDFVAASIAAQTLDDDVATSSLAIHVTDASIVESQRTVVTVSRGQSTGTEAAIVSLNITNSTRASLPATVTIPAGQASVDFVLQANENLTPDADSILTISANADGFTAATATVTISDHEFPFKTRTIFTTSTMTERCQLSMR